MLCRVLSNVRCRVKYMSHLKGRLKILNNKILALLGFASKAGKLSFGMNEAKVALEKLAVKK